MNRNRRNRTERKGFVLMFAGKDCKGVFRELTVYNRGNKTDGERNR